MQADDDLELDSVKKNKNNTAEESNAQVPFAFYNTNRFSAHRKKRTLLIDVASWTRKPTMDLGRLERVRGNNYRRRSASNRSPFACCQPEAINYGRLHILTMDWRIQILDISLSSLAGSIARARRDGRAELLDGCACDSCLVT